MGVDFRPYLQVVVKSVKQNWYTLIPEDARSPILKKGKVAVEFTILKDGTISGMKLAEGGSSGDSAMDRAAWGGIGASNPFPPLPSEFAGQYLALRFHFLTTQTRVTWMQARQVNLRNQVSQSAFRHGVGNS